MDIGFLGHQISQLLIPPVFLGDGGWVPRPLFLPKCIYISNMEEFTRSFCRFQNELCH